MNTLVLSPPSHHKPLSQSLEELVASDKPGQGITMNELLDRTEGRGLYLMMIILSLPFVIPFSIPGMSGLLGTVTFLLAIRLAWLLPAHLPRFIGERRLNFAKHPRVIIGGVKFLRFLEKWIKPRRTQWLSWPVARSANALLIAFMAFLLALPLPIPFTNTFPGYTIIFLASSMMEADGVMIWAGYAAALGTMVYFGFCAGAIVAILGRYYQQIWHFFLPN